MARKYKIFKVTEKEQEFMNKYKFCACIYCSYRESPFGCSLNSRCPAKDNEYLKKI